jgi:hypothetical protein
MDVGIVIWSRLFEMIAMCMNCASASANKGKELKTYKVQKEWSNAQNACI